MHNFFCRALLIFFLFAYATCFSQYRAKPIGISKRKYQQIRARKYIKRERAYMPKYSREQVYSRMTSRGRRMHYVNANAISRKRNKKAFYKKLKQDKSYGEYRDYVQSSKKTEKSNFSIYDK